MGLFANHIAALKLEGFGSPPQYHGNPQLDQTEDKVFVDTMASPRTPKPSIRNKEAFEKASRPLIEALRTHRVNTLSELCRIEKLAESCETEEEAQVFREPLASAWHFYVTSHQFLTEIRGHTRNYPVAGDLVDDALQLVHNDPGSSRSWNLAWLCLVKIREEDLITKYAKSEAWRQEMWGGRDPTEDEAQQLAECFRREWTRAVNTMLRHWAVSPVWR